MEFISARVLEYVSSDAKKLIKFLLENWYRPALGHHSIKIEDAFIKRRCLDWSFLNLHLNYQIRPGVVKLTEYTRKGSLTSLLSKWAGVTSFGYNPKQNDVIPIPKPIKDVRPFSSNYILLVDTQEPYTVDKHSLGDYIAYLSYGKSEVSFNDEKYPLEDGELLISSYQSLHSRTQVTGKVIIFSNYRFFYPYDYQNGLIAETI
jgi:hypothetical protein